MNILLISSNREMSPYPVFPLGLAFLASPLRAAGHHLQLLDLCFSADTGRDIDEALARFAPEAIVISIRNIDNVTWPGSRSYVAGIREVVDRCRDRGTVIVGGSGFSLLPAELFRYLGADYGVIGEGEEVLIQLIQALAAGGPIPPLPGVLSGDSGMFLPPLPVARIGTPNRSLFDVGRYRREGGMANVQTKRGCPFTCSYCTYPLLEGRSVRLRPVGGIIAELRELAERHGIDYVYFVDDIFNYPPGFALELCRAMAGADIGIQWSAFINPAFMTRELLTAMVAAGCDGVEFGTDSGSPAMLQSLGKSFHTGHIRESSRLCRDLGVDFAHYLLFGGPGESAETVAESFSLMDEVDPTAIIAMTGIRIYPGTPLHAQAVAEGMLQADVPLLEPVFYISPSLKESLCDMVREKALSRKNWIVPGLEVNMSDAMLEALRRFSVRGPLWKLIRRRTR